MGVGVGVGGGVGVQNYLNYYLGVSNFAQQFLGGWVWGWGWVKYFLLTIKIYFTAIFSLKSLLVDVMTLSTFSQRKGILYNMSNPWFIADLLVEFHSIITSHQNCVRLHLVFLIVFHYIVWVASVE